MESARPRGVPALFEKVAALMRRETGVTIGPKQRAMVEARLSRRMGELGLTNEEAYLAHLERHAKEENRVLVSLLTTHHTAFFREWVHFKHLAEGGLSAIVAQVRARGERKLRVWSAACSQGQEAYSISMFLKKHLAEVAPDISYEIDADDVCAESIAHAQNGVYRLEELRAVPEAYRTDAWTQGTGEISHFVKAQPSIKDRCRFTVGNLIHLDTKKNVRKYDLIFCRNVFIYFSAEQINATVEQIAARLQPGGLLFVGATESLFGVSVPLHPVGPSVYQRKITAPLPEPASPLPVRPAPVKACRVLVVDDSRTVCELLKKMLEEEAGIKVIATLHHPEEVAAAVERLRPDVVTLDIHMPGIDGVTLVKRLVPRFRVPIVMISALSQADGPQVLEALEAGAVDYVQKPSFDQLASAAREMRTKVRGAARARARARSGGGTACDRSSLDQAFAASSDRVIAIGASTGGTEALGEVLARLPAKIPPVLVVQHIPETFSAAFAKRLNGLCRFPVREAKVHERIQANQVLVAPGGQHMEVEPDLSGGFRVRLHDDVSRGWNRPSVDLLFESLAKHLGKRSVGVVLTGMGDDGARGLLRLRQAGARTLAQDEATSVVYGMPRAATENGAAERVVALGEMPEAIGRMLAEKSR